MVNRVIRDDPSKGKMHNRQALSWRQFTACLSDVSVFDSCCRVGFKLTHYSLLQFDNWPLYLIGLSSYQPFAPPASYLTLTLRSESFFRPPRRRCFHHDSDTSPSHSGLGFNTFHTNLLVIPSSVFWIINVSSFLSLSRRFRFERFVYASSRADSFFFPFHHTSALLSLSSLES